MERYWQRCIFKYLRCAPRSTTFVDRAASQHPGEPRADRGDHVRDVQRQGPLHCRPGVLALAASWTSKQVKERTLTGTVVDAGDGVTHIIPVADGYVIGSCIKHIPIAGRDITNFIQLLLREREPTIPADDAMDVAKRIKEKYCYVCPDMAKEFRKYDEDPGKWVKQYASEWRGSRWSCDVAYERFLGLRFSSPRRSATPTTPRPCRMSSTRSSSNPHRHAARLYKSMCSGGSTMFRTGKRLQRDVKRCCRRMRKTEELSQGRIKPAPVEVNVISHHMQRFAVCCGSMPRVPEFRSIATRAQYEEWGRRFAATAVFSTITMEGAKALEKGGVRV